jgi:hypothetical protein
MLEPRHVLELGRLFEQAGEKDAARREYQRFLELWMTPTPVRRSSLKQGARLHG